MFGIAIKAIFSGMIKRLLGAATALFSAVRAYPREAAIVALLLALAWTWRGNVSKDRQIVNMKAEHVKVLAKIEHDMKEAEANAIAAKLAQEAKDEQRRKDADNALKQDLADDRRLADAYASRMRYQAPRSAPSGANLPSGPETAQVTDRPGDVAELVGITRTDLEICTVNSRRLLNAHDWALPDPAFGDK